MDITLQEISCIIDNYKEAKKMLHIDRNSNLPIYQQIYEQIKSDILSGNFPEGLRITSIRALASELKVGRNSVKNAYEQLVLEGYITGIPGSGYVVNKLDFYLHQELYDYQKHEKWSTRQSDNTVNKIRYSFQYGELEAASFPNKLWCTYVADIFDGPQAQFVHGLGDVKGDLELRQQLKQYLYRSRGVKCETEQIIICSGTQLALEIIIRIFPCGKKVAMEEPCYDGASTVFQSNGFEIQTVPVDKNGIDIKRLSSISVPMVHIAPSHQFPTGAVMPIQNRMEILNLAYRRNMVIIEDDYDSEFRYKGLPIPSLQSIDQAERVIYVGTFSKALSAGLRMAYLVLPYWLLSAYNEKYRGYQCTVPLLQQRVLAKFMRDGHWEKHIRKLCLSQKRKHDILVDAIKKNMDGKVRIYGHEAGLHILMEFTDGQKEDVLIQKALACGVQVCPVSPFWLNNGANQGNFIVLGYGKIKEKDIVPAIELLADTWFNSTN